MRSRPAPLVGLRDARFERADELVNEAGAEAVAGGVGFVGGILQVVGKALGVELVGHGQHDGAEGVGDGLEGVDFLSHGNSFGVSGWGESRHSIRLGFPPVVSSQSSL